MRTKRCIGPCGRVLPIRYFWRRASKLDGRENKCADCMNTRQRELYARSVKVFGSFCSGAHLLCTPEEIRESEEELARIEKQRKEHVRKVKEASALLRAQRLAIAGV